MFSLSSEEETFRRLDIVGRGQAYVIRNSRLTSIWEPVERKLFSIAERSASSMIRTQDIGDRYREYLGAQKYDFDFNLAYIPGDFEADNHELFDRAYMLILQFGNLDLVELTLPQLLGAGFLSGIGFTMSIFISELAFVNELLIDQAKVGILGAYILAGILGSAVLYYALPKPAQGRGAGQMEED